MKHLRYSSFLLLLLIICGPAKSQDYFGMKYAESVIHSEAFDPIYGRRSGDQIRIGEFIFSRLWRWNDRLNLEADLLVSIPELTQDGSGLLCKLKPNLRWPDGKPLTSKDIAFTINVYKMNSKTYLKEQCANTQCEIINEREFILRPKKETANFAFYTQIDFANIQIFPEHIIQDPILNPKDKYVGRPMGSGPFQISEIDQTGSRTEIIFKRNPYSHEKGPNFKIREIRAVTEPSFSAQWQNIRTDNDESYKDGDHKIDLLIEEISHKRLISQLRAMGHLKRQRYARNSWTALALNTRKSHLNSTAFRVELDNVLDDKRIIKSNYGDSAKDITGPFIRDYGIYMEELTDRVAPTGEIIASLESQGYSFDKKKRKLYWVDPAKGSKTEVELRLIYNRDFVATDSREQHALSYMIEKFSEIGIAIIKDGLTREVFYERIEDHQYWDIAFLRYTFGWDNNISPIFTIFNDTGYENSQLTNELKIFQNSQEAAKRRSGERIHQHCYDNVPYIFLWHVEPEMYYRNIINDVTITPMTFFTTVGWWSVQPR